ncbi:MAG: ABC transporter ATP-binding protein [Desulfobacteraceae bacterium]|jgi:branched-chain amino acid transport system ATP-binding protein|nr:MAG: ABC transporter ATP-binding protein [Desulfobacteraceae bacterium]
MNDKNLNEEEALLRLEDIHLSFGGVTALYDVSIEVESEGIFAIIGPNGAGKTCIFNVINGFYRPQRGQVIFDGIDITRLRSAKIARLGIARTFQNIELYTGLTTVENLMAARHMLFKDTIIEGAWYFGRTLNQEVAHRKVVEEVIDFLEIENIRKVEAGLLPYGLRKRVELGRALAMEPKLLLLDEPMAGMNMEEKEDMARFVVDISQEKKIPIILVEHEMDVVMDIADKVMALDFGTKIAEGLPEDIKTNEAVIKAYLGDEI